MKKEEKIKFSKDALFIENVEATVNSIVEKLNRDVLTILKRKGAVVGISGGIDSSVTLALSAKAFGASNVTGILLPERDSSDESKRLALQLASQFGVNTIEENITDALEGFGCYMRRDEAVHSIFPEYNPRDYTMKIGMNPNGIKHNLPSVFSLIIVDKNGISKSKLLPPKEYLQIVAASNFKQRTRMSMLYYHAERLHFAVIGTPNKHEVEQGFFVKNGDGVADVMPIGNLYKSQVYQLAEFLNIPKEIIQRTPTTDTYPAEQTQEEFFFQLPFEEMDLLWFGYENECEPEEVSKVLGKSTEEVAAIYKNFERKHKTTEYLRMQPIRDY